MRVAVDATPLLNTKTGVGYFTESTLQELARMEDVHVTAFPISLRGRARLADVVPEGVKIATPPIPARAAQRWWGHHDWPRIDRLVGKPHVVHGPNFVVPPARAGQVVSVHDLTMVRYPELCQPATLAYPSLIRRAVARGAVVHTISAAVRTEVIDLLEVPAAQIVTVPPGYRPMDGGDADRGRQLAGRDDFALAVGTIEPRKDLPMLLRAIDLLQRKGTAVPLVHVGPDGWGIEAFVSAHGQMSDPSLVTRLGRCSDTDLRDLYAAARVFAYPSIYEGLGLPVLEAMSAGTPVVSTAVPAIQEAAGDAARLAPVGDPEQLALAIEAVWSDHGVAESLVTAGRANLNRFSWRRSAQDLVQVYCQAIERAQG